MLRVVSHIRSKTRSLSTLTASTYGTPADVVVVSETTKDPLAPDAVRVKMIRAAVSKYDVEKIYGVKKSVNVPNLGDQGYGQVVESNAADVPVGAKIVVVGESVGTWSTELTAPGSSVVVVPDDLEPTKAATFAEYIKAYALLAPYVSKAKRTLVQSVHSETFAFAVADVGSKLGFDVVSIINETLLDAKPATEALKRAGSTLVVPETLGTHGERYLGSSRFKELMSDMPPVALGVNAAGGASATDVPRALAPNGTLLTVGGAPFSVASSYFTQKNVSLVGVPSGIDYKKSAAAALELFVAPKTSEETDGGKKRPRHTGVESEFTQIEEFPIEKYDRACRRAMMGKNVQFVL